MFQAWQHRVRQKGRGKQAEIQLHLFVQPTPKNLRGLVDKTEASTVVQVYTAVVTKAKDFDSSYLTEL